MSEAQSITVFIADDHPILRIGLSMYLESKQNIKIIGEADNGFDAVNAINQNPPDVVLMDVDMPGLSGIEAIRVLRKTLPDMRIIVLSTYTKKEYIQEAMMEGANGYVAKNTKIDELIKIIEDFAAGRESHSPYLLNLAVKWRQRQDDGGAEHNLTKTEIKVLKHIAEGKTNNEIAQIQFVSIETIKTHVQRIFKKLEVGNRMEAVAVARKKNII
ncbi:helix-turn-helix transcriptional response regulator, LuxR family [Syntrophotalea carbinolica DSM 2380]|uniref:Helix-turn-helix transcriptional response regulator, LuxR family n=1 Tax=Syntrophotalea carbinolica (strain DSM 2380 / NBRC 103641 / GraBd1) TaxID=338963 RepID=Q3A4R1_SYNC1|nr:response regulator transcription factor [Syntrophotalea carbinolica]ABA88646.1 helix-turn-helix transcriptional response regulator, LuxR family [Syntrophotalea carbinolica DSM 2380]